VAERWLFILRKVCLMDAFPDAVFGDCWGVPELASLLFLPLGRVAFLMCRKALR
jgi:hypothetical protein